MRVSWGTLLAFLAAPVLLCAQGGGSISGRVLNRVTGAGISGATVSVCIPKTPSVGIDCLDRPHTTLDGVSDDAGSFRIAGVADGQYMILPSKDDFWPSNPVLLPFQVFGDTRLDFPMTPTASVHGRVFDPEGKPAVGAIVKLGGEWQQITGENGEYAFEDVPPLPGLHFALSAAPKAGPSKALGAEDGTRIVTTYYPSVVDSNQATEIEVQGVDLFGYDIQLRTAFARGIRGVVTDVDGKPAPHAMVTVSKPSLEIMTQVSGPVVNFGSGAVSVAAAQPVETKEDGTFVLPPMLEGEWSVRAVLRPGNRSIRSGVVQVKISKLDAEKAYIENLEIRLEQPFEVGVTADWGDTPPTPLPPMLADVWPLDGPRIPPSIQNEPTPQRAFHGFAGRYLIESRGTPGSSGAPPGYYLAAAMLDNRDVLGQVFEISGPASLKMIYKTGGGTVSGTVEKGAYALVLLMADATPTTRLGVSAWCDPSGGFSIPDVPPGSYTILAVPDFSTGASLKFPSLLAANGKSVRVEAGSTVQVDLKVSQ